MRKLAVFFFAALLLFCANDVLAQTETGQISGTVMDQQGGAVPNAKVTIRNIGTGATRVATTDERGAFVVTNLLPAHYSVLAEAVNFTRQDQQVELVPGGRVTLDIKLQVGKVTETIEVSGSAVAVNSETQTIGQLISSQDVANLPLLTRNPYDLVGSVGNTSRAADAGLTGRGAGYNINGLRSASTNVLLDGAANNDEFGATVGQTIPLDAVQEINVLTTNFTAEYGRAAAGVVNVTTKAGTNDFHGTAYEFGRYSALSSNTFENGATGTPKPTFTRNQFGYSVGGPIKKNKLFFFQSTEWLRVRSSATIDAVVPSAGLIAAAASNTQSFMNSAQLKSDFRTIASLSRSDLIASGSDPCNATGACDTAFPVGSTTPMFIHGQYNVPADAGAESPQNSYYVVGRVDWNVSNATQLYGRYALQNQVFLTGSNVNSPYVGFDTGSTQKNNSFLLSLIHTFSPKLTSQSKIVFNRLNNFQPLGPAPVGPTLFMFSNTVAQVDAQPLAFPGYGPFSPGNAIPFGGPQNFVEAYQDLSSSHGKHTFRFGGNYTYIRDNRAFGAYEEAVETLSTNSFGNGMEKFLNGTLAQFQAAIDPQGKFPCVSTASPTPNCTVNLPVGPPAFSRSNRYHEFGTYVEDSWKATRRLTFNLGVRWDYFGVQHNKNPNLDSNYYDAVGGNVFSNIRNGDVATVPTSPIGGLWKKDWNNFAPRVGVAWDMFGDGKTVLRGGYGLAYERNFGNVTFNVIQNPPNYAVISILPVDVGGTISITTDNSGPLGGSTGSKALPRVSTRNVDSNIRNAYAHTWSASFERQVTRNFVFGLDYSGSKGEKLYTLENPNRPGAGNVYLADPCTAVTKHDAFNNTDYTIPAYPCFNSVTFNDGSTDGFTVSKNQLTRLRATQYSNINRRSGNGLSLYNGLVVRGELRNLGTTGLSLRANYTYSHAFDNLSSTFSESANNFNLGLLDPFNPTLDRGNADFDVRHQFSVSGTWDVPFAKNTSGITKRAFDGWSVTPIITMRTGFPFTLFDCFNAFTVCPRAMATSRPGRMANAGLLDEGSNIFDYIDTSKIALDSSYINPIAGVSDFGPYPTTMLPRNYFRAPGAYNVDLGIYKTTKINERFSVQLRGEFFNMLNHSNLYVNYAENEVGFDGTNYTTVVHAQRGIKPGADPNERRNIQLAIKLIF